MKNIIKTDFKRALKGAKFPLAIILMFFVWEFNSKRFADSQDVLYLFVHVWGRSITPLLAMIVTSTVYVTSYCEDTENHFLRCKMFIIILIDNKVHQHVGVKIYQLCISSANPDMSTDCCMLILLALLKSIKL